MRGERGGPARERLRVLREAARPPVLRPPEVHGGWVPDGDPDDPFAGPDEGLDDGLDPQDGPDAAGRPGPRSVGTAAAVAAVVLAFVVAAVVWVRSAPPDAPVAVLPPRSAAPASLPSAGSSGGPAGAAVAPEPVPSARAVVVDVEGRVRRPGLVHLPPGARVADALAAAGGTTPGAVVARLNLARILTDGEQVLVPAAGDPVADPAAPASPGAAGTGGAGAGGAGGSDPLDLNGASAAALDQLPGVGPVLAGRIVAWRAAHGRFTSVDELGEVDGIGPKALERLRALVRV